MLGTVLPAQNGTWNCVAESSSRYFAVLPPYVLLTRLAKNRSARADADARTSRTGEGTAGISSSESFRKSRELSLMICASSPSLIAPHRFASSSTGVERIASDVGGINDRGTAPANSTWSYCD